MFVLDPQVWPASDLLCVMYREALEYYLIAVIHPKDPSRSGDDPPRRPGENRLNSFTHFLGPL